MREEFAVVFKADPQRTRPPVFSGTKDEVIEWLADRASVEVYNKNDQTYLSVSGFLEWYGQEHDSVNHPSHYTQYEGLEIIDLTEQMNFNRGNAVKYIARAGFKDPSKEVEDLEKAVFYLQREIARVKRKNEKLYDNAIDAMKAYEQP